MSDATPVSSTPDRRRRHRRHPAPPRAALSGGHAIQGTREGNNGTGVGGPCSSGVISRS